MGKVCDPTHTRPHTPHKNTRVICSTPKTLSCVPHFPVILSVSTVVTTLLIVALVKCFVCLCSTFYLLFFSHIFTFSFSCTCCLLYTLKQSQNYCAYQAIQVFIVFLRLTINTVDVTTLYMNSSNQIFAEPVCSTFLCDFLLNYTIAVLSRPNTETVGRLSI